MKPKPKIVHVCTACTQPYNKKDFDICPHCCGDGGGRTPKVWTPSRREKKAFAKKQSKI